MKTTRALRLAVPAALIAACSVAIAATPTVDGTRDASYGTTTLTSQKASVIDITLASLTGSAQSNQSNLGGVVSFAGSTFSFPAPDSDPALVTTGLELAVDLSELGWDGASPIKIGGWLVKDGTGVTITNQVIGGLPANSQNVGDATVADFSAITGDQYVTVSTVSATAATVDGTLEAQYGAPLFVNTLATTLTNATIVTQDSSNGSEIDAVYAYRSATRLYLFVSGNLRTQYDKIDLWFDVKAGGQNPVITGNSSTDFGIINNNAGCKFDTAFVPDYFIDYTGGSAGDHYLNYGVLNTAAGGGGGYTAGTKNTPPGERRVLAFPGEPTTNGQSAPPNGGSMEAAFNNLNTGGVAGALANPNPWTTPPGSDPNTVTTGIEIKVPLSETGWVTGTTSIKIGGFITGFNWDYLSNQVIGGVPATQDSYGFPANAVDFSSVANAGAQFVTYTMPGFFNATIPTDGTKGSGYTLVWVNNVPANSGNPTSFGDNLATGTPTPDINHANGSEIDAIYARTANDATNGGTPTLFLFAAGNIHDNNKLCIFLDTKAGGEQTLAANHFTFGLEKLAGLKFDAGFEPDYMVAYAAGYDTGTATSNHTLYAAQLPTDGTSGYGGIIATGVKSDTTTVLTGTFRAKNGFGNNTDATIYNANGSELDNVYAQLGTNPNSGNPELFLHIGGNLEPNNNKLEIFFDVLNGVGQNTLIYDDPADGYTGNPDVDFSALNRMGGPYAVPNTNPVVTQPGLTFETGFTADYYVYLTNNNASAANQTADIFGGWARLKDVPTVGDPGAKRYWGKTNTASLGQFDGGDLLTNEEAMACINNANVGGVSGAANAYASPTTDPSTVTTGMEIGIPLADLAPWDGTTPIKMIIFINGQNHDFVSQQSLQSMCKDTDPGEPRLVNFQSISGVQTMTLAYNSGTGRYSNTATAATPCLAPCPGDVDGNRTVNSLDLGILLSHFGQSVASGTNGDLDNNGVVNSLDLGALLSRFGTTCP